MTIVEVSRIMFLVVNVQSGKVYGVFKDRAEARRRARRLLKRSVPVIIYERRAGRDGKGKPSVVR
jgi:hypothetical protein